MSGVSTSPMRAAVARLMRPRSIAIVGVSPEPGAPGGNVFTSLGRAGFTGDIHLVSRTRAEVFDQPCLKTIDDLPEGVDVAVLCVPERAVVDSIEASARRKVGNIVIFAAGFAEVGGAGIAAQQRITEVARGAGMGIVGPNCLGLTNSLPGGVPLAFGSVDVAKVSGERPTLAIIAQSGALAGVFRNAIQHRGLPVSYSVSSGNEAGLICEDYLDHMLADPAVGAVAIYAEQLRDPRRFLALARQARAQHKPIVMLHTGSSAIARESAITHTYSITGNYRAMRALTARASVVLVDSIEELLDAVELLLYFPTPPTMGPAVMADSGAYKGIALDYAERLGIELPKLSPDIHEALVPVMPVYAPPANPLDMTAQAIKEPEMYDKALPLLLADPRIGSLVLAPLLGPTGFGLAKGQRILNAVKGATKPVVMSNLNIGAPVAPELIEECRANGIPFIPSSDRALRAVAYVMQYARALARPETPEIEVSPGFLAALGREKPKAAPDALTLVVRAERDPDWGAILEIGWGEPWRKALPETIILPPDLDAASIEEEMSKLPGAHLFEDRDVPAAARFIAQFGAALRADPEMRAMTVDLPV